MITIINLRVINYLQMNYSIYLSVGPHTTLPLGHQKCSIVQISAVQGSVSQHYASYFISINPLQGFNLIEDFLCDIFVKKVLLEEYF